MIKNLQRWNMESRKAWKMRISSCFAQKSQVRCHVWVVLLFVVQHLGSSFALHPWNISAYLRKTYWPSDNVEKNSLWMTLFQSEKVTTPLLHIWVSCFDCSDDDPSQCDNCLFISNSYAHISSSVIMLFRKFWSSWS